MRKAVMPLFLIVDVRKEIVIVIEKRDLHNMFKIVLLLKSDKKICFVCNCGFERHIPYCW